MWPIVPGELDSNSAGNSRSNNNDDAEPQRRYGNAFNARRHGHQRLSFSRADRTVNIGAVVRPRAPLLGSIIQPANDASQLHQWDQYPNLNAIHNVVSRLPATIAETSERQGPYETAEDNVSNEVSRLHSLMSLQSQSPDGQWAPSRSISGAPTQEESSLDRKQQPVALSVTAHESAENPRKVPCEVQTGFDCPIRAGPNGQQHCAWRPPKDTMDGFPKIHRVKYAGLCCPLYQSPC